VGRPSEWLASCAFNEAPVPLHIWGVREMNPSLFSMLERAGDLAEAGEAFFCYMMAMFGLDPEQRDAASGGKRRYRSSFRRLIEGWGFDSNGPEGAVLKGWVESRFGICPSFHKEIIERVSSRAWAAYVEEKMSSLTACVPVHKILFFNSLLSSHPLKGEGEYPAVGGEFRMSVDYV